MNMSDGVLVGEVLGGGIFGLPVGPPDPGSVGAVFLNDRDDFAFAVSGNYVKIPVIKAINNALPSSAQLSPPPRTYDQGFHWSRLGQRHDRHHSFPWRTDG